jgi:hypothetical protein
MTLTPTFPIKVALAAAVVAGVGFVMWRRSSAEPLGTQIGSALGGLVVDAADGAVSGVAYGIGDRIGVPRTNETECEKAIREGRTWDASFACPAGTFIKSIFN